MNTQVNERLVSLMDYIGFAAKDADAFARTQLHDVAREIVAWELWSGVVYGLSCIAVVAACVWVFRNAIKIKHDNRDIGGLQVTAAELHEIVKDHRDVWENVLSYYAYGDYAHWSSKLSRKDTIQTSSDVAEAALLGLGVNWLVSIDALPGLRLYPGGVVACWADPYPMCSATDRLAMQGAPPFASLSAVYAAISEVKRARHAIAEAKEGK